MAFSNIFRRHSLVTEAPGANYACMDENSIAETLLDELETHCQHCSFSSFASKTKRNSEVIDNPGGLLASTYNSSSKRRSSVDYSWLTPQNNILQAQHEVYHLSDILKMELGILIRNVMPEDCALVVNQFRRQVRSQTKVSTPETIIALFRKTLADYIDQKQKNHANANELSKTNEGSNASASSSSAAAAHNSSFKRNNRVLPKHQSEDEQHSIAELAHISLTSSQQDSTSTKPRSSTLT